MRDDLIAYKGAWLYSVWDGTWEGNLRGFHYSADTLDELKAKIEELSVELDPLEKELKAKEEQLKDYLKEQFTDDVDKLDLRSGSYCFTLSKTYTTKVDSKLLKADGIYEKYATQSVSYRLTNKKL